MWRTGQKLGIFKQEWQLSTSSDSCRGDILMRECIIQGIFLCHWIYYYLSLQEKFSIAFCDSFVFHIEQSKNMMQRRDTSQSLLQFNRIPKKQWTSGAFRSRGALDCISLRGPYLPYHSALVPVASPSVMLHIV